MNGMNPSPPSDKPASTAKSAVRTIKVPEDRGGQRLCLFGEVGIPLRPLLQEDAQHELLCATISRQLGIKRDAHRLHQGQTGLVPNLASIGG